MGQTVEAIVENVQEGTTTEMDGILKDVELLEAEKAEKAEEVKEEEVKEKSEGTKDEEVQTELKENEEESVVVKKTSEQTEIIELRQILREQKREIAAMKSSQTEDLDEEGNRIFTRAEILQSEISNIVVDKGGMIDLMAEGMREMPKYNDLDSVCSRANLDDIIEVIARELEISEDVDFNTAVLEVEKGIWSMSNPYKYIYETIKEFHPSYEKVVKGKKEGEKRDLTAVTTMQSTQNASGDSDTKGGWTAGKIDKLSEEELNSVPANVYKKYMQGELN